MANATQAAAPAGGPTSHTHFQDDNPGGYTRERQAEILKTLCEPFPPEEISTRPAIDCKDCENSDTKVCARHYLVECSACRQIVTSEHTDLDFVGHAEATARLLLLDPFYAWEPVALDDGGLPLFDRHGGLWIRLTIAGLTRLGYGDAGGRTGNNATKEAIGDAVRNAAMRFGMALDLWKATARRDRAAAVRTPVSLPARPTLRLQQLLEWSKTHWGHAARLGDVARWVAGEGFAESLVAGPGGVQQPFGPLLQERLAELAAPQGAGQGASPSGRTDPIGEGSQDTGVPAPGEAPHEPHPDEPADTSPQEHAPASGEDPRLGQLYQKVTGPHWKKRYLLEQDLGEVRRQGLADHNVEGPPEWNSAWGRFEDLIERRLRELDPAPATDTTGQDPTTTVDEAA
jgi:hypothetical protein